MERPSLRAMSLAALAVAPQAVNAFATSFPLERAYAATPDQLHAAHRARPWLDAASAVALVGLAAGGLRGAWPLGAAVGALGGAVALRALSHLIAAQPAHPAYDGAIEVQPAAVADAWLAPDAPVVGIVVDGEARCYPLAMLLKPAAIPDEVAGEPVVTIFCPMSRAATALHDDWHGARLRLQAVGAPNNDLMLFSDAAKGVVSQLRARVETGAAAGTPLRSLPATWTAWAAWKALHPSTTVGRWPTGPKGAYLERLIFGAMDADARSEAPLYAVDALDRRLPPKTPVLAVRQGREAWAVPLAELAATPVRHLELGGDPLVVVYDAAHEVAGCFTRRLAGRTLTFEAAGPGRLRDVETGREWDVTGRGPGADRLTPADQVVDGVYWFAWAHAHPGAALPPTSPRAARSPAPAARP